MGKRIATWYGVIAMGLFGALMISTPAQAQTDIEFASYQSGSLINSAAVCPDSAWQVRDFDNGWVGASLSGVVDSTTVGLTKPTGAIGTSIETTNLGLDVTAGTTITVEVDLTNGATTTANAVRMFFYDHPDGNTESEAPTATVAATGSGTLNLDVAADTTIGTFGLTYDASNDSAGTVKFENLTIGETVISFTECTQPSPSPSPSPEPTQQPSPEPTTTPGGELTCDMFDTQEQAQAAFEAGATELDGNGDGIACEGLLTGDKPGLPVTGSKLVWLAGGGLGLLATGAGALGLSKLRRLRLR